MADLPPVQSLDEALHWLDALERAPAVRTVVAWPLAAVLEHFSQSIEPAALRLRKAITRFKNHSGPLRPHFAYGELSKPEFALAHSLHIANHMDEIRAS